MLDIKVRTAPPSLAQTISDAPRGARGKMTEEAAVYLIWGSSSKRADMYPALRPNSKYKRTYILREGWGFSKYGAGIKVVNNVPYAKYVHGDNDQAYIHKGRWRTVSKIIADNVRGMIRAAESALAEYLRSKGL